MGIVCWDCDVDPISELGSYRRAFNDEFAERGQEPTRYELRCDQSFFGWTWNLRSVRDAYAQARLAIPEWSPGRDGVMVDCVRVVIDNDVMGFQGRLVAVMPDGAIEDLVTVVPIGMATIRTPNDLPSAPPANWSMREVSVHGIGMTTTTTYGDRHDG